MKNKWHRGIIVFAWCSSGLLQNAIAQDLDSLANHALSFAARQAARTVAEVDDSTKLPRYTLPDGTWKTTPSKEWTSGFFAGSLWYLYEYTRDPFFRRAAERWTAGVAREQFDTGTHDVGFKIFTSYGNGNRLVPSLPWKKTILQAAQTLSTRFRPSVGCIKSWDNRKKWAFPVIIDNMMNLELLYWAADHGGSPTLREIAKTHAETTMKNHIRPDGGTYHVVGYDTATGAVVAKTTHQGYADESVWARGQAWAVYGFTVSYRYTKDPRFLSAAERTADYYIAHVPEDFIPYWDFQAPGIPNEPRDVSAAAISSSALLELAGFVKDPARRRQYEEVALNTLRSLCSPSYLAEGTPSHAVLNHAVGNKPSGSEVDVSLVYADYYFIEALMRYRQRKN